MKPEIKEKINSYFEANEASMIHDVMELVSIPSPRQNAEIDMPYGVGPYTALKRAEQLMISSGFSVKLYDNRVVTGDMTELQPGLDILAHLDVVPCENNWTVCDPYQPILKDEKIYGRGTMDDKGPAVAALYAMKCVKTLGIKLNKNVRLILGSDEECGSSDVEYYYKHEQEAPMTFTPDANFPLINLEKGRLVGECDEPIPACETGARILSIDCGMKSNVIPEHGEAVVAELSEQVMKDIAVEAEAETRTKISFEKAEQGIKVTVTGKGAHAAYPEGGNNALTALLTYLAALPLHNNKSAALIKELARLFPHGDYLGVGIGIAMKDEISGYLTCSADMLKLKNGNLYFCFDARCPVCSTVENTKNVAFETAKKCGLNMHDTRMTMPHYVPADSDFVKTLLRVYEEWTGKEGIAESTGGGTYVHELKNGVAYGCETEGIDNKIHGADEFITIDQLVTAAKIFTQAIIELCSE